MVQNFIDHLVLSFIHHDTIMLFPKISLEPYSFIQNAIARKNSILLNNLRTKAASE